MAEDLAASKPALYVQFWTRYTERVQQAHPEWTNARRAATLNHYWNHDSLPSPFKRRTGSDASSRFRAWYDASFTAEGKLRHSLYIDAVDPDDVETLYQFLEGRRQKIGDVYGRRLDWEPSVPGRRQSRIGEYGYGVVTRVAEHEAYTDWLLDAGLRLRAALAEPAREWMYVA